MQFFTRKRGRASFLVLILGLTWGGMIYPSRAQTVTNAGRPAIPDPTALETPGATAGLAVTNAPGASAAPSLPPNATPAIAPAIPEAAGGPAAPVWVPATPESPPVQIPASAPGDGTVLAALLTAASLGGYLLYLCGLTRAKNCGHTSTLLLVGVVFALVGYWMGGFAVQSGGVGDAHAALPGPITASERSGLDHELGVMAGGRHWGFMGSAGFFLASDESARGGMASLFLVQAAWLVVAVGAALGAALERGRILAVAVMSFLIGAVIYPLLGNWIWGGGWLAGLGHEFGLGHGVVDLAGAGVVHETAGALALATALVLGPRHGRFDRARAVAIPGHNVPFTILGAVVLLIAWTAGNAGAFSGAPSATGDLAPAAESIAGLAAVNVILGAIGGALVAVFLSAWRRVRATPARLTRGLLGGAVALSSGSSFFDPWAALLTGVVAGIAVDGAMAALERRRIDDPSGATAVHGVAGAWGLLATGLFANGVGGRGMNRVDSPVRGLFFGGAGHQLLAQAIGCVVDFAVVFALGYGSLVLVQKILGNRVRLADEIQGLDWPQVGALGYQPDVEPEDAADGADSPAQP